jgi:thymidylate synthase (FAD)
MTINAAELIHVAGLRCCVRAEEEIRELFFEICRLVKHEAPELFSNLGPFCKMHGYCPEGERGCGRYPTIDELVKVYNRVKAVRGYSGD